MITCSSGFTPLSSRRQPGAPGCAFLPGALVFSKSLIPCISIAEPAPAFSAVHRGASTLQRSPKRLRVQFACNRYFKPRANSGMEMSNGSENLRSTRSAWLASVNHFSRKATYQELGLAHLLDCR
jgi:hypothetical protein